MCLRYSFAMKAEAEAIERAVSAVLDQGLRTGDIMQPEMKLVGTNEMGSAILAALQQNA
jgi:3-isopropylmalate dehydrogenase